MFHLSFIYTTIYKIISCLCNLHHDVFHHIHPGGVGNRTLHFSELETVSGSLYVAGLSTPRLEYSLHLRAAAAALLALSFTSSSVPKFHQISSQIIEYSLYIYANEPNS